MGGGGSLGGFGVCWGLRAWLPLWVCPLLRVCLLPWRCLLLGRPVRGEVGLVVCLEGPFLAASFPYDTATGHGSEREHGEDQQHHQFADEQAPEQAVSGELGRRGLRPGRGKVLGGGGQFAQGERGAGERHAVRPGPVGEQSGQAGGRPGDQGGREEEGQEADQQAVRDAAALGPGGVSVVVGGAVAPAPGCLACHVRPPLTLTTRSSVAGARSGPPVAPPPVRRRGCPRGAGRPGPWPSPRSWRGR